MPGHFTDIESIIRAGVDGRLDADVFYAYCQANILTFDELCNAVALTAAKQFHDSLISYDDADGVMNSLSALMIGDKQQASDPRLPEPAWTIYMAFDAGEYDRGDGLDPVEQYTKPLIRQVLEGQEKAL